MKIGYENGVFSLGAGRTAAEILAPAVYTDGSEITLEQTGSGEFAGGCFSAADKYSDLGRGLFSVLRTVKNTGGETKKIRTIFGVAPAFVPDKYLIPCVSYNGNGYGEGLEPKGTEKDGEPWAYAYERIGIPSCSVVENGKLAVSVFASNRDADSLVSSASIKNGSGGTLIQRIIHPTVEAPYTYCDNDKYTDRYEEFRTLAPGESFTVLLYVLVSVPEYKNYGVISTLDRVLEIMPFDKKAKLSNDDIWRVGMEYARTLISECRGKKLSVTGMGWNAAENRFKPNGHFEIGWCGQNIMSARLMIIEYKRTGEKKLLDDAVEIVDNWLDKQEDNGLLLAHYEWYTEGRNWNYKPRKPGTSWASSVDYKNGWLPETCNLGWAAAEMMKTYYLLRDMGIEKPEYYEFSRRICDFFVTHYSDEFGFGKAWRFDGTVEEKSGSIGGFVTMALIEVYKLTGKKEYLDTALRSLDFYYGRDLDNFVCTAGAIDCTCIDKETAGPFVISSIDAYELTKEEKYLTYAKKAAYYFCSWLFHYDAIYSAPSDFAEYGYYTSGSTAVSVQHPALDQWGELMCPEFIRLYRITGDEKWKTRALMMWYNAQQLITTETSQFRIHGHIRPVGSQNEAFYQARWNHLKDPISTRGFINDWLVAWVNLFRLTALERLRSVLGDSDFRALD